MSDLGPLHVSEMKTYLRCPREWEYAYRAGSSTPFYPSAGNDGSIMVPEPGCAVLDSNAAQIACGVNPIESKHPISRLRWLTAAYIVFIAPTIPRT